MDKRVFHPIGCKYGQVCSQGHYIFASFSAIELKTMSSQARSLTNSSAGTGRLK